MYSIFDDTLFLKHEIIIIDPKNNNRLICAVNASKIADVTKTNTENTTEYKINDNSNFESGAV